MPEKEGPSNLYPRRRFLQQAALGGVSLASPLALSALSSCETPAARKLGVALVGLGGYSSGRLAPALEETQYCQLSAIVTGTPSKAKKWATQYKIPQSHIYSYETFDQMADNPDIDIVYIVLPNSMHAEYTIRAAQAGKHVICEKPMSVSVKEAEDMIAACKKAGVKLQIGYRLQYEPHHLQLMQIGQEKRLGQVKLMECSNGFWGLNFDNWRFNRALSGGGPIMDMGIYCIQAARYTLGEEPIAVTAQTTKTYPEKFKEVEETMLWQMTFPSGAMASCITSYAANLGRHFLTAERGTMELNPAYGYGPLKGWINGEAMNLPHTNHQAVQMDAFARNILDHTPVKASGEDGLQDMKVIEAVFQAAQSGERVLITS